MEVLERLKLAEELVRRRRARATAALSGAAIPFAIAGGNAVAAWVNSVDPSAVRNTPDVVIAVRRVDAVRVDETLRVAGLHQIDPNRSDLFLEEPPGPDGPTPLLVRKAVPIVHDEASTRAVELNGEPVLPLDALVLAELDAGRTLNKVLVRDLIDVGLVTASWCDRLPPVLADRLRELLADPDG